MQTLDDITLIQQFICGEATLAANQKLRIEPAFNSIQLLAKRGGLIATMQRFGSRQTVLLRQASDYSATMRQILLARQFVVVPGAGDQPGFEQYRADEIPAGYEVTYSTAKAMWKEWWRTACQKSSHGIQLDILIFARDTWYPIRNIICSQGVLFITTLVSEVSLEGSDQLTWLRRLPPPRPSDTEPLTPPKSAQSLRPSSNSLQNSLQPTATYKERHTVATSADFLSKRGAVDKDTVDDTPSDLKQVLRFRQDKLYITTALGDVVVEGRHLTFRLDDGSLALDAQKPINLKGYRREGQSINQ